PSRVPLRMHEEALAPEALEAELARGGDVSFLYTIPTFQNPGGRTLGDERRRGTVELSAEHDLQVLEDDPYGLVRYAGAPIPSIHSLEGGERVTFPTSFSKTAAPARRLRRLRLPRAAA